MILINHHNCVNIDENSLVRNDDFFVTVNIVSQNIDGTVSDFQRTFPFQNETVFASRVWVFECEIQNVET